MSKGLRVQPEQFIAKARSPSAWGTKAAALRQPADALWDLFAAKQLEAVDTHTKSIDANKDAEAVDILRTSQFLYSLAAECALKGLFIKRHPEEVAFEMTIDGTGALRDARIKQTGKARFDTHNLEKLAELSGAIDLKDAELRELLAFSTICIKWFGRYPVPLDTSSDFSPRGVLPTVVFNHYYRDVMDPFLDEILGVLSQSPPTK